MKKTFYTTTEYLHKINILRKESGEGHLEIEGGWFALFSTRGSANNDANWMKKGYPKKAKEYGGPKVVKVIFEVEE